jgi:hypothetical protein
MAVNTREVLKMEKQKPVAILSIQKTASSTLASGPMTKFMDKVS